MVSVGNLDERLFLNTSFSSDVVRESKRARASSSEAARGEKRGRQPKKKKVSRSFVKPLPSRPYSHARVSGVLLD